MNTAYVALGANLGDPAGTVRAAFAALANLPLEANVLFHTVMASKMPFVGRG